MSAGDFVEYIKTEAADFVKKMYICVILKNFAVYHSWFQSTKLMISVVDTSVCAHLKSLDLASLELQFVL